MVQSKHNSPRRTLIETERLAEIKADANTIAGCDGSKKEAGGDRRPRLVRPDAERSAPRGNQKR
jgi:hypothetical protein